MLAHVPSFGRNPRGSPDFPAYPVPKACMHVLGTCVPRRFGVARSASSPKAALALGCSLTPGLRISFGRVTCMARAASMPGLPGHWVSYFWLVFVVGSGLRLGVGFVYPCLSWLGSWVGVFGLCSWCCASFAGCLWCSWLGRFWDVCGFVRVSLAPRRFRFRCAVWACVLGPGLGCAPPFLAGLSGSVFCAFFFLRLPGVPVPGFVVPLPILFLSGWAAGFFFFFPGVCLLVSVALFPVGRCFWLGVAGFGWVVPLCLFRGPVFGALWVGFCVVGGRFGGCGLFARGPPVPPPPFFWGGGGLAVPPPALPRLALALWLLCGVVGPSPLLAEVPVCYSPPLLAGFRCRCWWAVPATPGWGPLAAVVCGVWCVRGVVAGVWCGWSLATPGGGSCVLLPATPGWVSLPVVVGGPRHSWLGSAGGAGVWCVVCGGGVLVGLWLVCGVVGPSPFLAEVPVCYSPPLLAGFRCRCWWAVPATPGWGPLAALVCGVRCVAVVCWWGCGWCVVWLFPRHSWRRFRCATPRHSWLGFAAGGGGRSPPLLAGVRWRRWCAVCCVWCVAVVCWWGCGWCVVCWWGPSPLLAEVPLCYSPPLLAGVRWRRWCVVCDVWRWCVGGVVAGVWCGWSLATPGGGSCVLLPATPGWVSLPVVVGGPRHSWLGSAGGGGVWCVVCGVWCVAVVCWWGCGWCVVWLVPRHSWRRSLCATPRHSWLGFAAGGGGRSPPLLAGVRWRRWCVVCGVWCVVCWWGPSPLLA